MFKDLHFLSLNLRIPSNVLNKVFSNRVAEKKLGKQFFITKIMSSLVQTNLVFIIVMSQKQTINSYIFPPTIFFDAKVK